MTVLAQTTNPFKTLFVNTNAQCVIEQKKNLQLINEQVKKGKNKKSNAYVRYVQWTKRYRQINITLHFKEEKINKITVGAMFSSVSLLSRSLFSWQVYTFFKVKNHSYETHRIEKINKQRQKMKIERKRTKNNYLVNKSLTSNPNEFWFKSLYASF